MSFPANLINNAVGNAANKATQAELNKWSAVTPKIALTGDLGDIPTRQALMQFQSAAGLPVTGAADAVTLARLLDRTPQRQIDFAPTPPPSGLKTETVLLIGGVFLVVLLMRG